VSFRQCRCGKQTSETGGRFGEIGRAPRANASARDEVEELLGRLPRGFWGGLLPMFEEQAILRENRPPPGTGFHLLDHREILGLGALIHLEGRKGEEAALRNQRGLGWRRDVAEHAPARIGQGDQGRMPVVLGGKNRSWSVGSHFFVGCMIAMAGRGGCRRAIGSGHLLGKTEIIAAEQPIPANRADAMRRDEPPGLAPGFCVGFSLAPGANARRASVIDEDHRGRKRRVARAGAECEDRVGSRCFSWFHARRIPEPLLPDHGVLT